MTRNYAAKHYALEQKLEALRNGTESVSEFDRAMLPVVLGMVVVGAVVLYVALQYVVR